MSVLGSSAIAITDAAVQSAAVVRQVEISIWMAVGTLLGICISALVVILFLLVDSHNGQHYKVLRRRVRNWVRKH